MTINDYYKEIDEILLNCFKKSISMNYLKSISYPSIDLSIDYTSQFIEKMKEMNKEHFNNELNLDNLDVYFGQFEDKKSGLGLNTDYRTYSLCQMVEIGENTLKTDEFIEYIKNQHTLINIKNKINKINDISI